MSFIKDRVKTWLNFEAEVAIAAEEIQAKALPVDGSIGWSLGFSSNLSNSENNTDDQALAKLFSKQDLVFACVNELSKAFVEAPLVVVKQDADGNDEIIPEHQLLDIFNNNRLMSSADLFKLLIERLELTGLAFGMLEPLKFGVGSGGYIPIPTHLVDLKTSGPELLGYEIERDGKPLQVKPEDGVSVMFLDPAKYIGYVSPLAAALLEIAADGQRKNITVELLKNRNIPGVIVEHETVLTSEQAIQLKNSLDAATGGDTASRGKAIVLPNGCKLAVPIGIDDIDLSQVSRMSETRICMVFQVPPILIATASGLEATYANYENARESFYEETMQPLWSLVAESLTRQIIKEKGIRYKFDTSRIAELQEGKSEMTTAAKELFEVGLITKNEGRAMLEFDSVKDGDDFKAPPPTPIMINGTSETNEEEKQETEEDKE